jgi:hypothetical protein
MFELWSLDLGQKIKTRRQFVGSGFGKSLFLLLLNQQKKHDRRPATGVVMPVRMMTVMCVS